MSDKKIERLIRNISRRGHEIGLHPSYMTYQDPDQIKRELEILKNTFYGTAKILMNENKSFSELRKKVASRGGTTESGIKFLEKKHTKKVLINSINQAIKKARILRSLK